MHGLLEERETVKQTHEQEEGSKKIETDRMV